MKLNSGQRFLYARITILVLLVGAFALGVLGFRGFPFWYGGFVLCFWGALGLLNYGQHSSLWLSYKKPWLFVLLYGALAGTSFLSDTFGLNAHLWFYPFYHGISLLWVWLVLYPFGGLAILELLYFLAGHLDAPLEFRQYPQTQGHRFFDVFESLLFLGMVGVVVLGAIHVPSGLTLPAIFAFVVVWIISALLKLRFHITHLGQYTLVIVLTTLLATLSYGLSGFATRSWICLETTFFDVLLFGFPFWVWVGSFWFVLITLRLWIFLVLHPKVK